MRPSSTSHVNERLLRLCDRACGAVCVACDVVWPCGFVESVLMHRCAGYAGEADRDELEKELYQCLSAKTALILPFHWGDNQKSITQWIDRLLKRTIIGTDAAADHR